MDRVRSTAGSPGGAVECAAPHGKCGHGAASALQQQEHGATRPAEVPPPDFHENAAMTEKELADAVRNACIEAALAAYEDAGIAGLCAEGRWEAAISAMQSLDVKAIAAPAEGQPSLPSR